MKKILFAGASALMLAACAQSDNHGGETPADNKAEKSAAMTAPEADAARLERDVRYLADDAREGREAGTPGYDAAADYVAQRYADLGLKPGGDDESFFQTVPMRATRLADEASNTLSFTGENAPAGLEPFVDYVASGSARMSEGEIDAPLVFIGYGLAAEDHGRDDFAGLDIEGKIVVAMWGAPKFLNTEERAHYRATTAQRASERGAVGMIILNTPALSELIPFEAIAERRKHETGMSWIGADGLPHSTAPNITGSAVLNPALSERLFDGQPASWADIIAAEQSESGEIAGFDMGISARIAFKAEQFDTESRNVIGLLEGSDPELKHEYVVLSAHLDHEGIKPTPEEGDDELYNGAMDNAVGTSAMLEVARLLAANPPRRSVLFTAVTAEEKGLVGSAYNAANPTVPAEQIVANVNLDMPIMTYPFTDIIAFGAERSTMGPIVEAAAERSGLALSPDPQPEQGLFVRSDQYSYVKQGVPAIYMKPGFANGGEEAQNLFRKEHYHKASDEADLVDFEQLRRFSAVNYEIARGVADMDERPRWRKGDFFGRTFEGPMEE